MSNPIPQIGNIKRIIERLNTKATPNQAGYKLEHGGGVYVLVEHLPSASKRVVIDTLSLKDLHTCVSKIRTKRKAEAKLAIEREKYDIPTPSKWDIEAEFEYECHMCGTFMSAKDVGASRQGATCELYACKECAKVLSYASHVGEVADHE